MEKRFRELIDRCPSLANDHRVAAILSQEQCDKNALQVIQQLSLTPNFTVIVASCFRSVLLEVIQDLVSSLQELPALNLETHENVCIAFSKLLELSPFLLSVILQYFTFVSAPFQRLFHNNGIASSGAPLLEVEAIKLDPSSSTPYELLAGVYLVAGDTAAAKRVKKMMKERLFSSI